VLLTTLPAATAEQAAAVVQLYRRRWKIEQLHQVLKEGLQVERLQIDDADSLKNALACYWLAAWRVFYLAESGRTHAAAPAERWASPTELAVLGAKFSRRPHTVADLIEALARLGRTTRPNRHALPGTKAIWRGLRALTPMVETWELAAQHFGSHPCINDTS
jgi:hypothetical protein